MKNMLFMMVLFCVSSLAGQAQNVNANSFDDSLRSEASIHSVNSLSASLRTECKCKLF